MANNPFSAANEQTEQALDASPFNLAVVTGVSDDGTVVALRLRGDDQPDNQFPARIPEDVSVTADDVGALVLVARAAGDRNFVSNIVDSTP